MITFEMNVIDREAEKKLRKLGDRRQQMETLVLKRVGEATVSNTQTNYLRGQVLKRQSGALANSMQYRITGPHSLRVGPGMIYGAAHESGIPLSAGKMIYPKRAKMLAFSVGGQMVFARAVRQHVIKRPYLAPSITEYLASGKAQLDASQTIQDWMDKL